MSLYVGEIRLFAFAEAPSGWLLCDGKIYEKKEHVALCALLGDMYGGDGRTTFGVPDLRGRVIVGATFTAPGGGEPVSRYAMGDRGGQETVRLMKQELPTHRHMVIATDQPANFSTPRGSAFAEPAVSATQTHSPVPIYGDPSNSLPHLAAETILSSVELRQGHGNMQPSTVLNYCICAHGYWPAD